MRAASISRPSRVLYALSGVGLLALAVEWLCLRRLRAGEGPAPARRHPACSVLKPLSGHHEQLEQDLESHAALDYPGEWELVLGVDSEADAATPVARAFAARHPGRARMLVCADRPGAHPKVNQLIALSQAARHDLLVCTDGNIRVHRHHLRDVAAAFEQPRVGLVTHLVAGVGERRLGAAFDNQAWLAFVAPNVATAATLGIDQVVGKALAVRREVLERMGGWESVKDLLAEDQQLGAKLAGLGLRSRVCSRPVMNVQVNEGIGHFWARQTRWAMLRFRVVRPGFFLEPLLNPTLLSGLALACSPRSRQALALTGACWACGLALAQGFAILLRGHGFRPLHLALFPLQQLLLFLAWARGMSMRSVRWHGHTFSVGRQSRLSPKRRRLLK